MRGDLIGWREYIGNKIDLQTNVFDEIITENNATLMFKVPNEYRIEGGDLGSNNEMGNNGAFYIPFESFILKVIASDGEGWEHVQSLCQTAAPTGARCASSRIYFGTRKMW